jgi:hypothetical protein
VGFASAATAPPQRYGGGGVSGNSSKPVTVGAGQTTFNVNEALVQAGVAASEMATASAASLVGLHNNRISLLFRLEARYMRTLTLALLQLESRLAADL